jgi:hypothetical protein
VSRVNKNTTAFIFRRNERDVGVDLTQLSRGYTERAELQHWTPSL